MERESNDILGIPERQEDNIRHSPPPFLGKNFKRQKNFKRTKRGGIVYCKLLSRGKNKQKL